ncbi:cutinase-domain-containing protein [Colletotrichum acutatum]|uniref:cutinase n=1 Tax=Glomerella acutata TaxID=27357 RepID=A0AAD8UIF3_GLOAC|nr:cutinase-domain-containing protein [Colletotrichum acutatum]KAK1724491.1 cutinase-domain-containing protein [Colletotrichum acutatum]
MKRSTAIILALQCVLTPGLARVTPRSDYVGEASQPVHSLQNRQQGSSDKGVLENEVRDGTCKDTMFFFLRGSTQQPNMGLQPGPQLAAYLRSTLGADKIAIQGIEYSATLQDNLCINNQLCRPREVTSASTQIREYMDQCSDSDVVVGGYSQGAAMLSRVISDRLGSEYKDRIVAAVTFGNTMQVYNKNTIPGLAPERVQMFCNKFDPVCRNGLPLGAVMPGHRDYRPSAKPAAEFLVQKLAAAKGWTTVPIVSDIDLSQFADVGFTFREIYRGAPAGSSTSFNDGTELAKLDSVRVVSIFGRGAARVDALGVKMDGGVDGAQEHGGGGGNFKELTLEEGEYWIKTEVCNGRKKKKDRVGFFRASTSLGRVLEVGSRTNDRCVTFVPDEGRSFVGMHGESGEEVDSVGFIEYPKLD